MATRLAQLGAHVVLACRDRVRGEQVAAAINAAAAGEPATVMTVDTSDQSSVRAFGRTYHDRYGSLDVLVNNAGVLLQERRTSVDGVELTFATNVLGYHLVTTELLDALEAGAPSRVVNVASTFAFGHDLDDLQFERRPYDGLGVYAQSKACGRLLTWAFARRLAGTGITVNAMAPGLVLGTELYRHLAPAAKQDLEQYGSRPVPEGAETAVWLASHDEVGGVTGEFFEQGEVIPCQFRDKDAEERLWQECEQLVRQLEPGR